MVERIRTLIESRQLTPTQFADVIGVARPIVSHILSGRNKPSLEVVQRILAAMPDLAMPWLLNGTGPMLAGATAAGTSASSEAAGPAVAPTTPEPVAVAVDERARAVVPAAVAASPLPAPGGEYAEQQPASAAVPMAAPLRAGTPAPNHTRIVAKRFVANAVSSDPSLQAQDVAPAQPQPLAVTAELPPAVAAVQDTTPDPTIATPMPLAVMPAATMPLLPVSADETPGAALASALFAGGDKPIRRIVIFYRDGSFADYQPE
ncbi:transcriptional regulator with XRE-family HTH domain [Hymenobacter sp. UYAg731]